MSAVHTAALIALAVASGATFAHAMVSLLILDARTRR